MDDYQLTEERQGNGEVYEWEGGFICLGSVLCLGRINFWVSVDYLFGYVDFSIVFMGLVVD